MTRIIALCLTLGLAIGTLALPQTASADNGRENRNRHGHDDRARSNYKCPPGLANRSPRCVPPGQARRGETHRERNRNYRIGDRVDRDDFYYFDDSYDLPRLPRGQRYAVIDGNIVALNTRTYEILNLIRALQAITN